MQEPTVPAFPRQWQALVSRAADELRALALNENAKERFCHDPHLTPYMHRVAARYVAGHTIDDVLKRLRAIAVRGHAASAEYMGESCRSEAKAQAETMVFLDLVKAIDQANLSCSISLDLSHIGSLIDPELGYRNACRIIAAAASVGREVMISMEGSDRADTIFATYQRLHLAAGLHNVGITIPARLHRTVRDLSTLMPLPGRIRLVKGAYFESADVALERHSPSLVTRYLALAKTLLSSGHACSIATHDPGIQQHLAEFIVARDVRLEHIEFESLMGLGTEQLDSLQQRGFPTREYAVFGSEYFLYVLNRLAEEPVRLFQAIIDVMQAEQ